MDIFAQILREIIECIYRFSGDYGIAITIVTVLIRCLLIPLNIRQRRSLRLQQEIAEEAGQLKKKYQNNQQKLNTELQKLYQEKGTGMGGCLLAFLTFPIMLCLYQAIRMTAAAEAPTVLLPWVASLTARDQTMLLPAATLLIQVLPQLFPYIRYFRALNLQKSSPAMLLIMLGLNASFVFVLPSGVGLYYFVSGCFQTAEQLIVNLLAARRLAVLS